MLVNAPHSQLIGQQYSWQKEHAVLMDSINLPAFGSANNTNQAYNYEFSNQNSQQQQVFRFDEDASEVLNFVLNGGPKWGFRIRQLSDNRVIVSRVNKGPAEKCGLKVNDELLSVNNVPLSNQPRSLLLNAYPDGNTEKVPLLDGFSIKVQDTADSYLGSGGIELSKLDFAYQLIKHSSISNKLMLTVKRYLNPAYARASVAASNIALDGEGLVQAKSPQDRQQQVNEDTIGSRRKQHSLAGIHYAYKCCECYCDNEGKFDWPNLRDGSLLDNDQ